MIVPVISSTDFRISAVKAEVIHLVGYRFLRPSKNIRQMPRWSTKAKKQCVYSGERIKQIIEISLGSIPVIILLVLLSSTKTYQPLLVEVVLIIV